MQPTTAARATMSNKDLEIALKIKADLAEGQRAVEQFGETIEGAGNKAQASFSKVNETADQQSARLRAMVAASLAHQESLSKQSDAAERGGVVAKASASNWQSVVSAQNAAMQSANNYAVATNKSAATSKKSAESIQKESNELSELLGRIDPVIRKLDELDDMEQRLRASRRSGALDADTFNTFNGKLQAQRNALTGSNTAMKAATITAGQYQQAMRQLPAQITDITTSLVSGMPIWMVAVQQGGQIKDSFGGIGNASRALLKSINPLTLGIAAVGGAVVATGIAYYQGSREADEYNRALILTGNIAGTTADAMGDIAAQIGDVSGTQGQAAAALAEVARAGKFTERQFKQITNTAVLMKNTIGRAVSATIDDFKKLVEDPTEGIAKLNEQYHFLTLAEYEQIAALQDEGKEVEAVQLAIETLSEKQNRRMADLEENLGYIEDAWEGVKDGAAKAWDKMLGVGRRANLGDLEKELAAIEQRQSGGRRSRSNASDSRAQELRAEIARRKDKAEQARLAGEQQRIQDAAITAEQEIQKLRDQTLTKAEQKEKAIADYRRNVENIRAADPQSSLITEDQQAKDIAAINDRYADKGTTKQTNADAALNRQINERIAVLNAANTAEQKLSETQRFSEKVLATLEDGTSKLTAAQREAVKAQLATLAAADQVNMAMADDRALQGIQQRLLSAQGQQAEAAAVQLEKQYGDLLKRLEARGDQSGVKLVNQLIDVETAKARLTELQTELDRIFSDQGRQESSIQTQVDSGLISEVEARRQLVALHASTSAEVEKLLPQMEKLAELTGDPAMVENIDRMRQEVERLNDSASELRATFKNAFESGLSDSIVGLAKGTQDLEDATRSFVNTIAEAMLRLAADKLANQAFSGLSNVFDGIVSSAGQANVAMEGVKTTKIATDTAMTASSQASLATTTATSTAAAAETAAAWTPAATAASIGSWGTAAAIGLAAVVAALAYKTFSGGGHVRGPGTTTSDSIPALLSDQEYVTRAAVVTQPGALGFLDDFNQRGMAALDDWGGVRHATGGLAGVPAPEMPAPSLQTSPMASPSEAGNTTLQNKQNFFMVDDPQRIAEAAFNTRQGEESFYIMLGKNPGKIRSLLNI